MKECCICTLLGTALGMVTCCYLMVTNKKFKQFVTKSKNTIEDKVQEIASDISNKKS